MQFLGINRKVLLLIASIIILIIASLLITRKATFQPKFPSIPSFSPLPSASPVIPSARLSPYLQTSIGQTTENQISNLPGLKKLSTMPDGSILYTYDSPIVPNSNSIIINNGVVIFEKARTVNAQFNHPKISDYIKEYGQPAEIVKGSHYYGWLYWTYIYPNQGFTMVGNPNTDEVYEIQHFSSTSLDNYKSQFGQDLNPNAQPPQEGPSLQQQILFDLESHLPYDGNNFTISYDKASDLIEAIIYSDSRQEGEKELDAFLQKNGIPNKDSIPNLKIIYQ